MVQISIDGTSILFTTRVTTYDAFLSSIIQQTRTNNILPVQYFDKNSNNYRPLREADIEDFKRKTHVKLRLGKQEYAAYEGEFDERGQKHGFGIYRWPNGRIYHGQWFADKMHGEGTESWPNGSRYHGQFRENRRSGHGTFTWYDGRQYVGEYLNDMRHGFGTCTFPDGYKYEGQWRYGKRDGRGIEIFPNGDRYNGVFQDDKPVDFETY